MLVRHWAKAWANAGTLYLTEETCVILHQDSWVYGGGIFYRRSQRGGGGEFDTGSPQTYYGIVLKNTRHGYGFSDSLIDSPSTAVELQELP
jgi:hypothetical protein